MNTSEVVRAARALSVAAAAAFLGISPTIAAETVEDQKAVIDAQIELLKKQGELEAARRAVAGSTVQAMPTVVSAMTIGQRHVARLQLATGQVASFQEGDVIAPGVVLGTVHPRRVAVIVQNGKKFSEIPLAFALPPAPMGQAAPGTNAANIPPAMLPPVPSVPLPPGYPLSAGIAHEARPIVPAVKASAAPAALGPAAAPKPAPAQPAALTALQSAPTQGN